jgi:hypothetical protein
MKKPPWLGERAGSRGVLLGGHFQGGCGQGFAAVGDLDGPGASASDRHRVPGAPGWRGGRDVHGDHAVRLTEIRLVVPLDLEEDRDRGVLGGGDGCPGVHLGAHLDRGDGAGGVATTDAGADVKVVDGQCRDLVPASCELAISFHLHELVDALGVLRELVDPGLLIGGQRGALCTRGGAGHHQGQEGRGKEKDDLSQRVLQVWVEGAQ